MTRRLIIALIAIVLVAAAGCGSETTTGDGSSGGDSSAPQEWVEVMKMKGSTDKQSPTFKLEGGEQKLTYSVKGDTMPVFAVYVEKKGTDIATDGAFTVVFVDEAGKDSTMLSKDAGEYYIAAKAANCNWTLTLQEKR
jgi:hypothetical protein